METIGVHRINRVKRLSQGEITLLTKESKELQLKGSLVMCAGALASFLVEVLHLGGGCRVLGTCTKNPTFWDSNKKTIRLSFVIQIELNFCHWSKAASFPKKK